MRTLETDATSWIGTHHKIPVTGFNLQPGRAIYDVVTPEGGFEVWVTDMREDEVVVNIYDGAGTRVYSADAYSAEHADELASGWLTAHWG